MPEQLATHAITTALGAAIAWAARWWLDYRKDDRTAASDSIAALEHALERLQKEIEDVSEELHQEREARKVAEAEVRQLRVLSDAEIRELREALHTMRNTLQQRGLPVPEIPGWPVRRNGA